MFDKNLIAHVTNSSTIRGKSILVSFVTLLFTICFRFRSLCFQLLSFVGPVCIPYSNVASFMFYSISISKQKH